MKFGFDRIIIMALALASAAFIARGAEKDTVSLAEEGEELEAEAISMATTMLERYTGWEKATFEGKVRCDRLPISPMVKIYAERNKLLQVSVRVPILGEVGRLKITPDSCLIVNKLKKTYCSESISDLTRQYPGLVNDIQSLLLGRVVILGVGELDTSNLRHIKMKPVESDKWIILPKNQIFEGKVSYGYVILPNGRTSVLYGMMEGTDNNVTVEYTYPGNTMNMKLTTHTPKGNVEVTLDFTSVRWGGTPMPGVNLSKYKQVGIRQLLSGM